MAMFIDAYIYFPHDQVVSTMVLNRQHLFLISNSVDYKMGLRISYLYSWSYDCLKSIKMLTL